MIEFIYLPEFKVDGAEFKFKPIGHEIVQKNGRQIALISWKSVNEPHIDYSKATPRDAYETTIAFMNREYANPIVILSQKDSENLFDRMCKKTRLKRVGIGLNGSAIFELR